jgi:DNA repair photolyase
MARITFSDIESSSILTPLKKNNPMNFDFSLNPYVGCAFGCSYCYVRRMQYGDDAGEKSDTWGDWVKVKRNAVALLQKSWRRLYGKKILIGSATDPYQPVERKLGLTRALLESLVMAYPERIHVLTRSPLAARDIDVMLRFGEAFSVGVSIPTDDDGVRKVFEPSAPSIPQRLEALSKLHDAGIRTNVNVAPVLPCDPKRLGGLIRGRARSWWVDEMRYHWTDPDMKARFLNHGWGEWLNPNLERIREEIREAWEAPEETAPSPGLRKADSLRVVPSYAGTG